MLLFFFYLLLVASLRFSLVYLCIQFACDSPHFLVWWISRLIALWSKGVYIPSLHFFCENNPEPWRVFFRPLANEGLFFYNDNGILYTSESNWSGQWRHESTGHMYDINGLTWLSFWWLTSICGTFVSLRVSCVNYALRHYSIDSYKIFLHTHCFGYAELIFPLRTCFTICYFVSLKQICLLEPTFLCDECSVNLYIYIFLRR